jgi:hypothetical protein
VVETLKASGHEVSLVINAGSSDDDAPPTSDPLPLGVGDQVDNDEESGGDPHLLARHNTDPFLTSTSQSTDGMYSSQDTLDDITESPLSFEGDTDFSGMEKVLVKSKVLDLHRTSSAPLTHRERVEASIESSEGGCGEGKGETVSLDCLDGASGESGNITGSENQSYESRLQMRTSSDGTVDNKPKKKVSLEL